MFRQAPSLLQMTLTVSPRCLLTELADGSGVLLDLETKFYFTLNETGVFVWKTLAAKPSDAAVVVAALCEEFDVARETAQTDVDALVAELTADGLVADQ